ncbi:MAG: DUF1501 domain-containing protein [Flavobacteriales bacterium]|jgi:uncharacterized protein (DUF1501 family)|nr:DUF1501 domain-containing protein [Flavobacteriales bacterium]
MTDRRDFLKMAGLASASLFVPKIVSASNLAGARTNDRVLVIIQLDGGNDGLNTVIPYRSDIYYSKRPRLAISGSESLRITDELALHPALMGMRQLLDNGEMAIVNSVGYENPNRSHFRSTDIWETASNSDEYLNTGWIGRTLDTHLNPNPYNALELNNRLSIAMKGRDIKGLAIKDPSKLFKQTTVPFIASIAAENHHLQHHHNEVDFLHKTLRETVSSAAYIHEKSKIYSSTKTYPGNNLGKALKTSAELIISGSNTSIYYVSHSGFDTHSGQAGKQKRLLEQYDKAVSAFVSDLKQNNRFKDVAILTFSEFGRRVAQNASGGTDHGAANCSWVIGGGLKKASAINASPDLSDLDHGDLKYQVDFRQLYATLLNGWLGQDSERILGGRFDDLGIV